MIRYSHVSLLVLSKTKLDSDLITAHLGVQPSSVRENHLKRCGKQAGDSALISYFWAIDSPKSAEEADPTGRLSSLADIIEPFGGRLLSLDPQFRRFVDVVYHVTPQRPDGITGEFDWFRMPSVLMRRFVSWNLDVSYEAFWFNHPDWVNPVNRKWLPRVSRWFRRGRLTP
jgi:hypothetical protein